MRQLRNRLRFAIGALVTAFGSTAWAYRTAAELPNISSPEPVRWAGKFYGYVVNNRTPVGLPFARYQETIDQALSIWTVTDCRSFSVGDLGSVTEPAKPGDGVNTVEWIPNGWVERGFDPSVPGQTDVLYEQDANGRWVIKEADIYLNGEANFWDLAGETASSAWSVRSVVLHEGGHALGLLHPCEIVGSATIPSCSSSSAFGGLAMNPVYNPSLSTLSQDDVDGLCSIYPKGLCVDRVCLETEMCTAIGCRLVCGSKTCDDGQVCYAGNCIDPAGVPPPIEGAAKDAVCSVTSDCQRGLSCIAGICQGGTRKLGDLCGQDAECQDGVCTSAGYCAEACQVAGSCHEPNAECTEMVGGIGACLGIAKQMGDPCDSADDCVGKECLVDGERAPVCTRACDKVAVPCLSGWECAEVEGRHACVTAAADNGCGCRLGESSRQPRSAWVLSLLAVITMILRRGQGGSRRVA